MKTIENLKSEYQALVKKAEDQAEEVKALRVQLSEKESAKEEAAEAGDFEAYSLIDDEARRISSKIYVLEKSSSKTLALDPEEVNAAWKAYADTYEKDMKKLIKEYREKNDALFSAFEKIVELQRAAIRTQRDCFALSGDAFSSNSLEQNRQIGRMDKEFPMYQDADFWLFFGCGIRYFGENKQLDYQDSMKIYSQVNNHRI